MLKSRYQSAIAVACGILSITSLASAQPPTKIAFHEMGESFTQWSSITGVNTDNICGPHPKYDKSADYKTMCRRLSNIRNGATDTFWLTQNDNPRPYGFLFVAAKLAGVTIEFPEPDTSEQIKFLRERYGEPFNVNTVEYQNAFGAKWNCLRAFWNMPDGTSIIAAEVMRGSPPERWLTVRFITAAQLSRESGAEQFKNPY